MSIAMPKNVADALIACGLFKPGEVGEPGESAAGDGEEVATVATPATPPEPSAAPEFVPPKWFPRLKMAMLSPTRRGACLFGPRGTGKTFSVHELARMEGRVLGEGLITFQAAHGCTIDDLVGVRDLRDGEHGPISVFTDGPLTRAIRLDSWLLIEEANVMHPGVFSKLNTLTDGSGDKLALPDGTHIGVGPNFRVVLAFNEGAAYSGTREVNAALRDRLMPIYAEYLSANDEVAIVCKRTGCDKASAKRLVGVANKVRAARAQLMFDFSPRALFDIVELVRDSGAKWHEAFEYAVLDRVGDPLDKKPTRDSVNEIANLDGIGTWPAPTFGGVEPPEPVAPEEPGDDDAFIVIDDK